MDQHLFDDFQRWWRARNRSANTIQNYLSSLRRFAAWTKKEGLALLDVGHDDINRYLEKRLTEVAPVTVHGDYKALSSFYGWLVDVERELTENPVKLAGPITVPETERYIATRRDYDAMMSACDRIEKRDRLLGRRNAALIALLWSGMRREEPVVLDVRHVDPMEGDVLIPRTKTRRVREVTVVNEDMVPVLRRWLRVRPNVKCEAFLLSLGKSSYGQRLTADGVTNIWAKVRTEADLPPQVTPQSFRRGQTAEMIRSNVDGALIMAHFGWTSERMKARYVREESQNLARKAIKQLRATTRKDNEQ